MTTEADTLLNAVVGGCWKMTRKLGEGGMGAVYFAEGVNGEGERAIKVLHKEFVKEDQVVSRFYAEAEASKRLVHPNIARIFESGTMEGGEPYLLMELLKGQALADANPEGSRMHVGEATRIVKDVLVALAEAHRNEIVHRDLKPDNIFLCTNPAGGPSIVKLLDFGIARVIDAAGGGMRKTKTGMLLGTPGYMSPEQLRNSKSVDPRSDLWSLCTVFYELLSGRDPYGATNDFARLTAVFTQDSIPVDRDAPELAPWRDFFKRAFSRDINLRFQSAGEMSNAIDAILRGEPLPAASAPVAPVPAPAHAPHSLTAEQQRVALEATSPAGFQLPASLQTAASPVHPDPRASALPAQPQPIQPVPPQPIQPQPQPAAPAGSNKLVWGLIAAVLVVGAIVVGLAVKSMQDDKKTPPAPTSQPTGKPTATPTTPPGKPPAKK